MNSPTKEPSTKKSFFMKESFFVMFHMVKSFIANEHFLVVLIINQGAMAINSSFDDQFFVVIVVLLEDGMQENFAIACNGEVYDNFYDDFIVEENFKLVNDLRDKDYIHEEFVPT
jgi:hypothetical protein